MSHIFLLLASPVTHGIPWPGARRESIEIANFESMVSTSVAVCEGDDRGPRTCDQDSTHRVCAKIKNDAGFFSSTGQSAFDWSDRIGPSGDWCICKWATAKVHFSHTHLRSRFFYCSLFSLSSSHTHISLSLSLFLSRSLPPPPPPPPPSLSKWIKKVGCEHVEITCAATDVCDLKSSYHDYSVDLKPAHDCVSQKCAAQWNACS